MVCGNGNASSNSRSFLSIIKRREKVFPNQDNMKSWLDFREMLGDIAQRLEKASSGDLAIPSPTPPPPSVGHL
jgi:hypothetical protein